MESLKNNCDNSRGDDLITNEDIARLREIFITREECGVHRDAVERRIGQDSVRLAVIESQLKLVLWVLTAVGGGIITMLLKMFIGG